MNKSLNLFLIKRSFKISPFNKMKEMKNLKRLKKKHKREYLPSSKLEKRKYKRKRLSLF